MFRLAASLGLLLFCFASPARLPFLSTHGNKTDAWRSAEEPLCSPVWEHMWFLCFCSQTLASWAASPCKGKKGVGRPVGGLPCKKVPRRHLGTEWYNIAERKRKQKQEMRGRSASSMDEYKKLPTERAQPLFLQTSAWQLNLCEFCDVWWRQGMGSVLCSLFPGGSGKQISLPSCITEFLGI